MPQDTFKAFDMTTTDASTIGIYTLLATFNEPVVRLHIVNSSDQDLYISYDGIIDNDLVMPLHDVTIIPQQSAAPANKNAQFNRGLTVWGMSIGATGFVYVAGYYL